MKQPIQYDDDDMKMMLFIHVMFRVFYAYNDENDIEKHTHRINLFSMCVCVSCSLTCCRHTEWVTCVSFNFCFLLHLNEHSHENGVLFASYRMPISF